MYKKISGHGVIGDMHSVALVCDDGTIDYCCMPHIDSPTVFASILDEEKGGSFRISPAGRFESRQEYVDRTNILRCVFRTENAEAHLFDLMPVEGGKGIDKKEHSIHRYLRMEKGKMAFELEMSPRPDYARDIPEIRREGLVFRISGGKADFLLKTDVRGLEVRRNGNGRLLCGFTLEEGEEAGFCFVLGKELPESADEIKLKDTRRFWREWLGSCVSGQCSLPGEHDKMLQRSLLVLKLLIFRPTGAIAAAATMSLPERIGGSRNWDYRFTWIRDASFTLKALFGRGYIKEAERFVKWLNSVYSKHGSDNMQIMYSLRGESDLKETELEYLEGYRGSRPVRVGNAAYAQDQWDIYGEIMDTALRLSDYAGKIDERMWPFFRRVCGLAAENWRKPDFGIWEDRSGPHHFVYSKVMCWVALDRGLKIASRYGFEAPVEKWEAERDAIREEVLEKGYSEQKKSFIQKYGSEELDSSLLLLPLMNFLPVDDERTKNTIRAVKQELMKGDFLLRYQGFDGIQEEEGTFLLCNFWLIEDLALSGQLEEAERILSGTVAAANHLGLFSEEYDEEEQMMLGNFPQAFTHIGFINAVMAISRKRALLREKRKGFSFTGFLRKAVPFRVVLNGADEEPKKAGEDIAAELKSTFNILQGAFFDIFESRVNYGAMKQSDKFRDYLDLVRELNGFDLSVLDNDNKKRSFWINIYNILIIHGVIDLDVGRSVLEVPLFFKRIGYMIDGGFFSPERIEHAILRGLGGSPMAVSEPDPRIHFALVCAASSCPPIEFYDPDSIDHQLDIAGKSFINRDGLVLSEDGKAVYLSKIFQWYRGDFGDSEKDVLEFAARFADKKTATHIKKNLDSIRIEYLPYNWDLNRVLE